MLKKIILPVIATSMLLLTGCGHSDSDSSSNSNPSNGVQNGVSVSGNIVNRYLKNATVFIDSNNNRILDAGEVSTTTDDKGFYSFNVPQSSIDNNENIVAIGGTDYLSNAAFGGILISRLNFTDTDGKIYLTPLTTLITEYLENNAVTKTEAETVIASYFSIQASQMYIDYLTRSADADILRANLNIIALIKSLSIRLQSEINLTGFSTALSALTSRVISGDNISNLRIITINNKPILIVSVLNSIYAINNSDLRNAYIGPDFAAHIDAIINRGNGFPVVIVIDNNEVYLPYSVSVDALNQISNSSLYNIDNTNVSGFVYSSTPANNATSADLVLDYLLSQLTIRPFIDTVSTVSKSLTTQPYDTATGQYQVSLVDANTVTTKTFITNIMIQLNNIINNTSDALIEETSTTDVHNAFRLSLTVQYISSTQAIILASAVSESDFTSNSGLITTLTDGGSIGTPTSTIISNNDNFVSNGLADKADFLFVIDDSGSMSQEQNAISEAALAFKVALEGTGLDVHMGVISTSFDSTGLVLKGGDFIENDYEALAIRVKLGTSGSATETGIYNSEKVLSANGAATLAGYPRAGASLSVIILSDEESQYTNSGNTFDVNNNLFVSNNYQVYSIVDSNDNARSQYDDLSYATNGSVSNINDLTSFQAIMDNIAIKAGGSASAYTLSKTPQASTITVMVNGVLVTQSRENGWQFIKSSNNVVFYGSAIPNENDTINISYDYISIP